MSEHDNLAARLKSAGVWDAEATISKAKAAGRDYATMQHICDYWEEDGSGVGSLCWRLTNQPKRETTKAAQPQASDELWWEPMRRRIWDDQTTYGDDEQCDPNDPQHLERWKALLKQHGF